MYVYKLTDDNCKYGEYSGFVIVAKNQESARMIAMDRAGKSQWIAFANCPIDCIGTATAWEERIILESTLGE